MSSPWQHAEKSALVWGGKPEDYLPVHDWLDATKETFCDFRHRALRHHSQGVFECERQIGKTITNSDGKKVPVRYIAELHIMEDCDGRVPSVQDWLEMIQPRPWMNRKHVVYVSTGNSHKVEEKAS